MIILQYYGFPGQLILMSFSSASERSNVLFFYFSLLWKYEIEQAMITLQEMAVFDSLYGSLAAKLILKNYLMIVTFFFFLFS